MYYDGEAENEAVIFSPHHKDKSDILIFRIMDLTEGGQDPAPIQVDPKWYAIVPSFAPTTSRLGTDSPGSIHSALREFFQPLKTSDSRADFFSVYRKESEAFDKDYTKKYDEDLNTSLIFVSR